MSRLDTSMTNAFNNIEDSEEALFYDNKSVNSLKLRNFAEDDVLNSRSGIEDYRSGSMKKKRDKKKKKRTGEEIKKVSTRKIVNLPAGEPYIKLVDGEERLCFKYNTRISESALSAMPKAELEENEFCVRFDLDSVDISKLNEKFKADNCVYPRANLPHEMYTGNRWSFETECNRLAWQFVTLNLVLLYGKKGLIQRAVDSYRKLIKSNRSHQFYKEDSFYGDIEKRKGSSSTPCSVYIQWTLRGTGKKCKINVAVDSIDYSKISDEFKARYSVLDDVFDEHSFGLEHWESKNEDTPLAVKIAYVNVENTSFLNAVKAIGLAAVLKRAIAAYKQKRDEPALADDENLANDVVSDAIDRAFTNVNFGDKEELIYDD